MKMKGACVAVSLLFFCAVALAGPPRPAKSEYLISRVAAFATSEDGVHYSVEFGLRKKLPKRIYAVVEFENPEDAGMPFRVAVDVAPTDDSIRAESPRFRTVRHETEYSVNVTLFGDAEHTSILSTHTQRVLFSVPPQYEAWMEQRFGIRIL